MLCATLLLLGIGGVMYPGAFTVEFAAQVLAVFCGLTVFDWILEACFEEVDTESLHV